MRSSIQPCATQCEGRVEFDSEWAARKRQQPAKRPRPLLHCPAQAKSGLEWATSPSLLASKGLSRGQKQIE